MATSAGTAAQPRPPSPVQHFADWEVSHSDAIATLEGGSPQQLLDYFRGAVKQSDIHSLILLQGGTVPAPPPALATSEAAGEAAGATADVLVGSPLVVEIADTAAAAAVGAAGDAADAAPAAAAKGSLASVSFADLVAELRRRKAEKHRQAPSSAPPPRAATPQRGFRPVQSYLSGPADDPFNESFFHQRLFRT